jgi:hypothetical protein
VSAGTTDATTLIFDGLGVCVCIVGQQEIVGTLSVLYERVCMFYSARLPKHITGRV